MGWRSRSHVTYDGKAHLIWCPKRRRVLADADVRRSVQATFRVIAEEFGFWIEEVAGEADHVHVCLEVPPKSSIARVVGILKRIGEPYVPCMPLAAPAVLVRRVVGGGDAVRTVGDHITADLIQRYIRRYDDQQATNQPELF